MATVGRVQVKLAGSRAQEVKLVTFVSTQSFDEVIKHLSSNIGEQVGQVRTRERDNFARGRDRYP